MAIHNRLQALGQERFGKVLNMLMRGQAAVAIARMMQQPEPEGWGLFHGVAEKTIAKQLDRLRLQAAEGAFGPEVAKAIVAGATPQIKLLARVSIPVLERLEEMADFQRNRILMMVEKESKFNNIFSTTEDAVEGYRKVLMDLQKVRFDLGLDEFKGPVGMTTTRGASQTTIAPDGTSTHKQVFETITQIERIFDERKIPRPRLADAG